MYMYTLCHPLLQSTPPLVRYIPTLCCWSYSILWKSFYTHQPHYTCPQEMQTTKTQPRKSFHLLNWPQVVSDYLSNTHYSSTCRERNSAHCFHYCTYEDTRGICCWLDVSRAAGLGDLHWLGYHTLLPYQTFIEPMHRMDIPVYPSYGTCYTRGISYVAMIHDRLTLP